MERSRAIAGVAGVMALVLIMVLAWFWHHWRSKPLEAAVATAAPSPTIPSPTLLLPPPAFVTKPVPRAVVITYHPKHARIRFSGIEPNFQGTWAAYPALCPTAWYRVESKAITVAGAGRCDLRGVRSAAVSATTVTSATLALECHHNDYQGRESWALSQPRPGALTIRPTDLNGPGNALSLIRCPVQTASTQ